MRRALYLLATAAMSAGVVLTTPVSAAPPTGPAAPAAAEAASVPDELLVGYRPGVTGEQRGQSRGKAGATLLQVVAGGRTADERVVERVRTPRSDRAQVQRRFAADPAVAYVEPNWIHTHAATSNDPSYLDGSLWGAYGDASTPANAFGSQAAEAWAAGSTGSSQVYVGVIDEGIDVTHPDLADNVWTNPHDPVNGIDDDRNGKVDDVHGWDFAGGDSSVYDGTGDDHGTHVAGTVGAVGGNGTGVAGVAWDVTLISAKFLGGDGGTTSNAIKAIDYLTDLKKRHGLNLVATNNSWGGGGFSQSLYDAIERAGQADILFVAAAGNGGSDGVGDDNDKTPHYPSSYANSNVVAVAALTSSGARSSFSNYGASSVDLGAPGSGIRSTLPGGTYGSYNGTSMATPHVTGAAALYAAARSGTTALQLKSALLGAALPTSSLTATVTGGRLDASSFVAAVAAEPDTTAPAAPQGLTATAGEAKVAVTWTANTESDLAGYRVVRDGAVVATLGAVTSWTDTAVLNGTTYSYSLTAVDASGNESPSSSTVAATPVASAAPTLVSVKGYKLKGQQRVDLTVSGGSTSASLEIRRTGTSTKTTTVAYATKVTDVIGKGTGTYTYRVCQAAGCSNELSVTIA